MQIKQPPYCLNSNPKIALRTRGLVLEAPKHLQLCFWLGAHADSFREHEFLPMFLKLWEPDQLISC